MNKKVLSVFFIIAFLFLSACGAEQVNATFILSNFTEDSSYNIYIDGEEPSEVNLLEPGASREIKKLFKLKDGELPISIYI